MSIVSVPTTLRDTVFTRDKYRCVYCQSQQILIGAGLTLDHIIPQSLNGPSTEANLCTACYDCNLIKGNRTQGIDPQTGLHVTFFHAHQQKWPEHFQWSEDKTLIHGLTPTGRVTVNALKLNRPQLVTARQFWLKTGIHPPAN